MDKNEHVYLPACRKKGELITSGQKEYPSKDMITDAKCRELIRHAIQMQSFSYAPYSNFRVGAALLTKDHHIYTGCNIENASYSPTNCAERTAIFKAVSEGRQEFSAIAIVGGQNGERNDYCPPCGVCRQVMMEFCVPEEFLVILAKSEEDYWVYTLSDLFPMGFSPKNMAKS